MSAARVDGGSPASLDNSGLPRDTHILAIAPTPFFSDYGCHVRIAEEACALAAHGVQTTIATYASGRDLPGLDIRRASRLIAPKRIGPGSSLHKFSMDAALVASGLRLARARKPVLIHGHLHEGALIGWALARRHRIPMVFDFQGSLTAEMIDHGFLTPSSPAYVAFRAIERWIVHHADAIVTSTRQGAELLDQAFGCDADRITVVPDGVNAERFCPPSSGPGGVQQHEVDRLRIALGLPAESPVVVYLGLLAEYQGITHLLRAIQALEERRVPAHFLIMGFPGEERYRILAERLGIGHRVTFTGAIRYERAPTYLALGDVAVSPKLSLTEGNGKLVNYMAMALPVVAYDTAVNRELMGDLGIYAPRADWTALSIELEHALADVPAARQRGIALREKAVAEHSFDDSALLLLETYRRVMQTRKRR